MKTRLKGAGANVAFSAAFKYLEKDPVKNLPKLLKWADNVSPKETAGTVLLRISRIGGMSRPGRAY